MTFNFPLGLLGLIGIPILILVYIIKSKFTEQTIASTYLWTLSERFLKRKKRVSLLTGIISLILQLLAVTIISLAIAQPVITVPDAANEYCFILDGSGSMRMETANGITRFEAGKKQIEQTIDSAVAGSKYTLIYVGDSTNVVFPQDAENADDTDQLKRILKELQPAYNTIDLSGALGEAQERFMENPGLLTYLVTDKTYETANNIRVVNMAKQVDNFAVSGVSFTYKSSVLKVSGVVTSYENDRELTVGLFLDGSDEAAVTARVSAVKGEPAIFNLETVVAGYSSIKVKVLEKDGLALDNEYVVYNVESESSYDTLIVSEKPFFIKSMLQSLINAKITVVDVEGYSKLENKTGYGLYVFDSVDVSNLDIPTDGTVWLFNVEGSMANSGFTVQGEMDISATPGILVPTTSSSTATQKLMKDLKGDDIYVTRYLKCGFYRNFTTLYSLEGNPVIFAGTSEEGNREVVFAFDLHQSNLPLLVDYAVLMRNLVTYSFPDMIDQTNYECGESAQVNVIANCESIRVESPSGQISYLNLDGATDNIDLKEVGCYTVNMTVAGTVREFYIWSALNEQERAPTQTEDSVGLQGQATTEKFDGEYDPLLIMFIVLAVIFLADWMVYCYEKYQLR